MSPQLNQALRQAVHVPLDWAYRLLPHYLLDEGAGLAYFTKVPHFQVFPEGWGAPYSQLKEIYTIQPPHPLSDLKIRWSPAKREKALLYKEGEFRVPQSEGLPEEIRDAHFRFICPTHPSMKLCLILAGWGEHGYNLRMRLVRALHAKGIGSLLLENPYHGRRILPGRAGTPVLTVAEPGHLVRAAAYEGRGLLHYFNKQGYEVGVAGFSMGGTIAAWISLRHPYPLPTTLMAAPYSPEVGLCDGIMRRGIVWSKLANLKDPEEKLRKLLRRVSLLNIPPPKKVQRIIMLAARNDRIIPPESVRAFHEHWSQSELRWRPGGHISMWLFDVPSMAQSITDSFA
jgi:pimeloyl-ACP methyl ester carboxylesterase